MLPIWRFVFFRLSLVTAPNLSWSLHYTTCLCRSDSIPSRTFLCSLILSLLLRSLRLPSQLHFGTPWCAVLGLHPLCLSVFGQCFLYEGLHLLVCLFSWVLSSLFGKAHCFLHLYSILAGARNLIYNTFQPFTKQLLMCAFSLFNLSSRFERSSKRGVG